MSDETQDDLNRCFRLTRAGEDWVLEVATAEWSGRPHSPELRWHRFRRWKREPDADRLAGARAEALAKRRFFLFCTKCRTLNNRGHMHGDELCQGCAEKYLRILY